MVVLQNDSVLLNDAEKYKPTKYTEEQFLELLNYIEDKYDRIPIVLASGMGFRRAEIFGLRWENIDFENKVISIGITSVRICTSLDKVPKNKTSLRTISGPDYVFDVLKAYKKKAHPVSDKEKLLSVGPSYYSGRFKWLLEKFEIPRLKVL